MKLLPFALFIFLLSAPAPAAACDQKAISKLQPKISKAHTKCQSDSLKAQTFAVSARSVLDAYNVATPKDKRKLKSKFSKARSKAKSAQKKAVKSCGSFQKSSDKLLTLASMCAPLLPPAWTGGEPVDPDPGIEPPLPDPDPTDPGTTPTPQPTPGGEPPAPSVDPAVVTLVQNFRSKGYVVALHGNTAVLASTIFDVTISGFRFLFYPNGVIWHPAQNLFLLRDYFQPTQIRALRLTSGLTHDFIAASVTENVPAAVAERGGYSLVIFKIPQAPTVGFGVLRVPDGAEYLVLPEDFYAVIYWLFPETYYLQLLQYQIISNMLTMQYDTALNIITNFPGSQSTFEYDY